MMMDYSEKKELLAKIAKLEEEKTDLEIMLEAVTGHSDGVEEELLQRVRKILRTGEKRFRLITETVPVPILVTQETDGVILFANDNAATLFGVRPASLPGRIAQEFHLPEEKKRIQEELNKKGIIKNMEIKGKKENGRPFRAELTVQPFQYNEQECLLSIWYDITERRALEKQLLQSRKMEAIGTLAGGIAHDFNNILTAIFGYTELSLAMLPKENSVRSNLERIYHSAKRAKELVRQILSFCRQSEQIVKPFRMTEVIKDAMKLLRQIIPSHIRVNVSIRNSDAIVIGDPTQVHQVLMNLCSNAADAMHQTGGIIDVLSENIPAGRVSGLLIPELRSGLTYVRLSVVDNGPGISKDMMERIFDPFFTTKAPGRGTGMGLSVVHGIVKHHGGAISVESEAEKRTAFHVYFPLAAENEKKTETVLEEQIPSGKGRILLIDDEDSILEIYKEILESIGYRTDTRNLPQKALALFRQAPDDYDLVITDYAMPHMTGCALAEKILRIRPDIPVILYSGYNDPMIREKTRQAGIAEFLPKPFTRNELAEILCRHLGSAGKTSL